MAVSMSTDANGRAIQTLRPDPTGVANTSITGSSARITIPTESQVVRLAASGNCYIKFGDGTVTATTNDSLFPVGVELFVVDASMTHVAVIQEGAATGTLSVTRMK